MEDGSGAAAGGRTERGSKSQRGGHRRLVVGLALSCAIHLVLLVITLRGCGDAPVAAFRTVVVDAVEHRRAPLRERLPPLAPPTEHDGRAGAAPSRARARRPALLPAETPAAAGAAQTLVPAAEPLPPPTEMEPGPAAVVPSPRQVAMSLILAENESAELEARLDHDLAGMLAYRGGGDGEGAGGGSCFRHEGHWWCPPGGGGGGGGSVRTKALKTGIDLYCW